jgi:hypothetical protein
MTDLTTRLKPDASRRVHLLLAAGTWTLGLGLAGLRWALEWDNDLLPIWIGAAVAVGLAKAAIALRPAARRIIKRIHERGDGRCAGGFFSWRTWIFVVSMIFLGRLLRVVGIPVPIVGLIYVTVGVALLAGSGLVWRAWFGTLGSEIGS